MRGISTPWENPELINNPLFSHFHKLHFPYKKVVNITTMKPIAAILTLFALIVATTTSAVPLFKQESSFYGCLTDGSASASTTNRSPFCDRG
jgi:hypothetical protein